MLQLRPSAAKYVHTCVCVFCVYMGVHGYCTCQYVLYMYIVCVVCVHVCECVCVVYVRVCMRV